MLWAFALVLVGGWSLAAVLVLRQNWWPRFKRRMRERQPRPAAESLARIAGTLDVAEQALAEARRLRERADAIDPIGPSHAERRKAGEKEAERAANQALRALKQRVPDFERAVAASGRTGELAALQAALEAGDGLAQAERAVQAARQVV